jgi:hypothetical protein
LIALTTNATNLIVACAGLIGVCITSAASIGALVIAKENRRKLTTPGEGTGTIGEQIEQINPHV